MLLTSLWDRDAYGSASTRAIRDTPLFGVGVGAFTLLSMDYVRAAGGPEVPFDNAQNWFRHQLAELGVVGCAGWILWIVLFAGTLIRGRAEAGNAMPAASLKGALLGLTAASMLGVPSLSPAITLTFWTFAFWYLRLLVDREEQESKTCRLFERRGAGWVFVTAVVVAYAAGHGLRREERSSAFPDAHSVSAGITPTASTGSRTRSAPSDGLHEKA